MLPSDETLLEFPCDFRIKVIGHNKEEFEVAVLAVVRELLPTLPATAIESRPSDEGKYLSLTINFRAHNKKQIDEIYIALTKHKDILMVF